jgi:hypothetical protein
LKKLCLFFIIFVTSQAKDCMILTFPRSGSSFFRDMIAMSNDGKVVNQCWYNKEKHNHVFCIADNFFSQKCLKVFPKNKKKVWDNISKERIDSFYKKFTQAHLNATKENFIFQDLDLFNEKFNIIFLYRHRRHTFPSSAPHYIQFIYDVFIEKDHNDPILIKIKKFLLSNVRTGIEKQCSAHIVVSYMHLKHCERYDAPIIEWCDLISFSLEKLEIEMDSKLPDEVGNCSRLANCIVSHRMGNFSDFFKKSFKDSVFFLWWKYIKGVNPLLAYREKKYRNLNVEPFCQDLIKHMKTLDKEFGFWNYLI